MPENRTKQSDFWMCVNVKKSIAYSKIFICNIMLKFSNLKKIVIFYAVYNLINYCMMSAFGVIVINILQGRLKY